MAVSRRSPCTRANASAAGRERRVVLVEAAGELGLVLAGRLQFGTGRLRSLIAPRQVGLGNGESLGRLVERCRGGAATGHSEPPARGAEAVAVVR